MLTECVQIVTITEAYSNVKIKRNSMIHSRHNKEENIKVLVYVVLSMAVSVYL